MQKRVLGRSGIVVSAIGLGCMPMNWAYGTPGNDEESIQVIHRAIELGVTLFDTADMYGPFTNEELLGRALAGYRDQVIVASKGGYIVTDPQRYGLERNGKPAYLKAACNASLRRLRVDYIDLYYLHRPDPEVPIEESVGALLDLLNSGKIRAIGLSECDVETLERAACIAPISALQSEMSLWTRDPLAEILPWCQRNNVAFLPYAPLGRGFLTGNVSAADTFISSDFRARNPRFHQEARAANQALIAEIGGIADRIGATKAQVALAWVLAQGEHVIPIPGTKRRTHLEDNVAAAALKLSPEDMAKLDALPPAVGSRY